MKKVGLNFNDLRMAVLVQRVVPAEYAYVIHTQNPSSGSSDEIYAEVVKGLGESIVSGMVPGSSLAFTARKDSLDNPQVFPPRWLWHNVHCWRVSAASEIHLDSWMASCFEVCLAVCYSTLLLKLALEIFSHMGAVTREHRWELSLCQKALALQVVAYPSKSDGMFVTESLIFRSDSNGEDLEGYAGAGLYDSITMDKTILRKVDYGQDRWIPPVKIQAFSDRVNTYKLHNETVQCNAALPWQQSHPNSTWM